MSVLHIVCIIFCYDIWFYFSHILLHLGFYNIHKIHHSIDHKKIIYKDTYTSHYLESPFQSLGFLIPLIFIGPRLEILAALLFVNVRGMLRHDHRFFWLIGNHHVLHHKHPRYNYGEYWIDRLLGTDYPNKDECIYGFCYL